MTSPFGRREFLSRMWRWGVGLVALAGAWTSWDILRSGSASGLGGTFKTVPTDQVPEDSVLVVREARAYLTKIDGEVRALWWKCPHLGCRVPFCESSGQFECPCHGSSFNRAGEYRGGPSPRGLDGFAVDVVDGLVVIDTGTVLSGKPPGPESLDEPPRGPSCTETTA